MQNGKPSVHEHNSTRRRILTAVGTAGLAGLAGCGNTGGSTDSTTIGILSPMNGAYSSLGPGQREGAEVAVQRINDSNEFDVEIDAVYGDTETEAGAAQSEAQRVIQEEGAEYLVGAISSSVSLSLNEFANQAGFIYFSGAGAVDVTGEACNEWVYRTNAHTAQIAEAISAYTVNNLGTNVWFHIADYAYGDSVYTRVKERMENANDDFTEVGQSKSELGSSNYGSYISQISNSDADVAILGMTGGDLINFIGQAVDQGLKDDVALVAPTMTFQVVRGALGADAVGTYGGVRYLPTLETGHNQEFVETYQDEKDAIPDVFARDSYDAIHMLAETIDEVGTTDSDEIKDEMAGRDLSSVFGDVQFRPCDHQAENPTWMGELVQGDGDMADVELLHKVDGSENLLECGELGCNLQ